MYVYMGAKSATVGMEVRMGVRIGITCRYRVIYDMTNICTILTFEHGPKLDPCEAPINRTFHGNPEWGVCC